MCPKLTELLSWNGPTVHVCCFMLARASTKTFVSRVQKTAKKSSLAEKFVSRVTRQPSYHCLLCSTVRVIHKTLCYGKVHPRTGHGGPEGEQKYSSALSLTRRQIGVGGQRHAPAASPPGKIRYPLYRRLVGPEGRSGRVRKNLASTGIRSPDRPARSKSLY